MSTDWRNDPEWKAYTGLHPRDRQLALEHDGEQAVEAYKRTLKARIEALPRSGYNNGKLWAGDVLAALEDSPTECEHDWQTFTGPHIDGEAGAE